MAVQPKWDKYEAVILIDALFRANTIEFSDVALNPSFLEAEQDTAPQSLSNSFLRSNYLLMKQCAGNSNLSLLRPIEAKAERRSGMPLSARHSPSHRTSDHSGESSPKLNGAPAPSQALSGQKNFRFGNTGGRSAASGLKSSVHEYTDLSRV